MVAHRHWIIVHICRAISLGQAHTEKNAPILPFWLTWVPVTVSLPNRVFAFFSMTKWPSRVLFASFG
jgi:hypothetical protein